MKKKFRINTLILFLLIILGGCGVSSQKIDAEAEGSFVLVTDKRVGDYNQTIIYEAESKVEYAFLFVGSHGHAASTMLYTADGAPKTYKGKKTELILISTEKIGNMILSKMYDSESYVMYVCSLQGGRAEVNILPLRNSNGELRIYRQ